MLAAYHLSLNSFEVTKTLTYTNESSSQHKATQLFTKTKIKLPEIFHVIFVLEIFPVQQARHKLRFRKFYLL